MAETDKSIFKAILGPILPYFTEALVTGLSIPDDSHFTDTGLKMAVLKGRKIIAKRKVYDERGCEFVVQTELKRVLPNVLRFCTKPFQTQVNPRKKSI